jgi:hypothetical protein
MDDADDARLQAGLHGQVIRAALCRIFALIVVYVVMCQNKKGGPQRPPPKSRGECGRAFR